LGDLNAAVYALDSTTIDLCLSLFDWAPFRSTKPPSSCIYDYIQSAPCLDFETWETPKPAAKN
jgi:hypothetical protein